ETMRSAIRVLTSARKRLPPGSVSDGSEIALGTTSSSTEPLDRSIRSGGLLHQKSRLSLPIVTSLTHRTRMTRQSVRIRKKHARKWETDTLSFSELDPIQRLLQTHGPGTPSPVCVNAGKFKSRGKGKRTRQESRPIDCPAQVHESLVSHPEVTVTGLFDPVLIIC
ncbi:hypothetical protein GN958_ATG19143, partial [Phytophthora infestans]